MSRAALADSIPASEIPPVECVNRTLEPDGVMVLFHAERVFSTDERRDLATVFVARQLIADEVERLLAILDAIDGDDDLELNVANMYGDPRLEDAEGLTIWQFGSRTMVGDEDSEAAEESGIADLDGLAEQLGRMA